MEGCCAVEREVDRVLTKFNTTQQVGVVEEKDLHAFEEKDMAKNTMIVLFFSTNLQNIESSIEDQIQQLERLQREISESGGDESTISPLQVHLIL